MSTSLADAIQRETLTPFGHALAGALGGVFSNAVVYPLDTIKTRIQGADTPLESSSPSSSTASLTPTSLKKHKGMLTLLLKIWKRDGIAGFYNGFAANMLNTFSMQFAYFYFHTFLRTQTLRRLSKRSLKPITQLSTSVELLLGALAGALAQIFTIPVAVIATRQQLYDPSSTPEGKKAPTLLETASEIIEEDGIAGLWTGLKPGLVLTVNPAITYGVFERVKGVVLAASVANGGNGMSPGMAFLTGVLSKTLATVVTYPYIFAKVRLQAKHSSSPTQQSPTTSSAAPTPLESNNPLTQASYAEVASIQPPTHLAEHPQHAQDHFASAGDLEENKADATKSKRKITVFGKSRNKVKTNSAVDILRLTLEREGVKGWYKGMQAQILKAVLSQGILFMAKGQFEKYALILIILAKRLVMKRS